MPRIQPVLLFVAIALVVATSSKAGVPEKEFSGWSIYIDNDSFVRGGRDSDYTAGLALKLSGTRARSDPLSIDSWLEKIDRFLAIDQNRNAAGFLRTHGIAYGLTLFTPEDLSVSAPIPDQHPYASLAFVSNARLNVDSANLVSYQSILTIGVLGLPIAGEVQQELHKVFGITEPEGWDNQISEGGEFTFMYSISRSKNHRPVALDGSKLGVVSSLHANLGLVTDLGASIALRWGNIKSPWWSFNLHQAEYMSLGCDACSPSHSRGEESYFWAGASFKYRIFNGFLEGQFRSSEVTYDRDELNDYIAEIWFGYTHGFQQGLHLSAFIRARTQEIDQAKLGDPLWGGFTITQSY